MTVVTPNGWEVDLIADEETPLGNGLTSVAVGPFVVNITRTADGLIIDVYPESSDVDGSLASIWLEDNDIDDGA